jgi:hypothetical protein
MPPKKPSNVKEIVVAVTVKDRDYNEHAVAVEIADYETVEMFMKRIEAAIERVLTEVP